MGRDWIFGDIYSTIVIVFVGAVFLFFLSQAQQVIDTPEANQSIENTKTGILTIIKMPSTIPVVVLAALGGYFLYDRHKNG